MDADEILIINDAGNLLFYYEKGKDADFQNEQMLMANFLIAIQNFAKAMEHGAISSFEMSKRKILIRNSEHLPVSYIVLIDSDSKLAKKPKKLEEFLHYLKDEFEKRYSKEMIRSWDGNVNAFEAFKECLK